MVGLIADMMASFSILPLQDEDKGNHADEYQADDHQTVHGWVNDTVQEYVYCE